MRFKADIPIWMQLMNALETEIATGQRKPGEKLPGSRELAKQFDVNPNTAARVYQELEKKGLCQTRRGTGTFITEDEQMIFSLREEIAGEAVCQFLDVMETLGISRREAARWILKEDDQEV
ncbi:MAG: GntR family transcriptional regulator [Clostridia bacterium]|nr:GntR family transcriptional regulator [Clostridia bacterium]